MYPLVGECPTVAVSCPDTVEANQPATFEAHVIGANQDLNLSYKWTVSEHCEIKDGQDTSKIAVEIVPGAACTATVEVVGLDASCPATASCTTTIPCGMIGSSLFNTYGEIPFSKEKNYLGKFAAQLKEESGAMGYILAYGEPGDTDQDITVRLERAKKYLIDTHDIEAGRIVIVDGGYREKRATELWITPTGATPPTATPTVSF